MTSFQRPGQKNKSDPLEDVGDSTSSVELEKISVLRSILTELVVMNNYLALMNNTDEPPQREEFDDTTDLSQ